MTPGRIWQATRADGSDGRRGLTSAERDELAKLRKENRVAFFAKHQA